MDVDSCVGALESAPPAQLPGDADGTDRRAGPLGRPTATFGSARSSSTHATPPRLTSLFTPKMVKMAVIVRLRAPQIQPGLEAEAMRHSFPIASTTMLFAPLKLKSMQSTTLETRAAKRTRTLPRL